MAKAFALTDVLTSAKSRAALCWEPFRDGVEASWVYRSDDPDGPSAAFLRYAPCAGRSNATTRNPRATSGSTIAHRLFARPPQP